MPDQPTSEARAAAQAAVQSARAEVKYHTEILDEATAELARAERVLAYIVELEALPPGEADRRAITIAGV